MVTYQDLFLRQDYERRGSSENIEDVYLHAKYPQQENDKWTEYGPLQEKPDLFLRFAKVYEQWFSVDLVLGWARKYGLLGYVPDPAAGLEERRTVGLSWEEVRRERTSCQRAEHPCSSGETPSFTSLFPLRSSEA